MPIPKIEERTLYPPLVNYLKSIGFKAIGESKIIRKSPDIIFQFDSISFVIEVKIGKPEIGLKAVAQASDYARKLNTQNIIILIYPEKYRREPITDDKVVEKVALDVEAYALVLTEYWTESLVIKPFTLFDKLKQQLILKEVKVDFKTTVELIGNYVKELNSIIYKKAKDELISEVVNKLDLFSSIGDLKDKETAEKQVINLASYLLFNQLLFYHIYTKKDKTASLTELEEIEVIKDIQIYFNKITKIDYQSIYRVNILGHIPKSKIVIDTLNEVIKGIKLLRAEHITQDLAGRFFHELIPFEVRKVLAAFYTHPIAAELLAGLTIDSYDEAILDPACGSGTLLVASYKRKQDLYQKLYGYKDNMKMHKNFIENEITGIDIMPFAAHISAINLTMQNIEQETNRVRIATLDSLEMVDSLKALKFKRNGIEISPYSTSIQLTIDELYGKPIIIEKKGAVSAKGKGSEFYLKPVDVVIMNPPFTNRTRLPKNILDALKINLLNEICGNNVNLWGYFLALADLVLKKRGKIGAVIPINLLRGKTTAKIREFLFKNYHIRYIIKPIGDLAFSENASFKDILLIAEKRKPQDSDLLSFIMIKKTIKNMDLTEIKDLIGKILNLKENLIVDDDYEAFVFKQKEIKDFNNLMPLFSANSIISNRLFNEFLEILKINPKNFKLSYSTIKEGFLLHKGTSTLLLTRNLDKSRVERANLIIENENETEVEVIHKKIKRKLKINKNSLIKSFRSITGIKTIDISGNEDFLVLEPEYKGIGKLIYSKKVNLPKLKNEIISKGITNVILPHKLNILSPNSHLIAIYSNEGVTPTSKFYMVKGFSKEDSKIITLCFNSIIGILQMLLYRSETMGFYCQLSGLDYSRFLIINPKELTESDKVDLLNLFDKIKDIEFPSILKQFETRFKPRIELDKAILKILGFDKKEINDWLPKIYDALIEELKIMKKVK